MVWYNTPTVDFRGEGFAVQRRLRIGRRLSFVQGANEVELSEERKRQIRAEVEAALRAEQEAEQQYREQVRRELQEHQQAETEKQYREQVLAELGGAPPDVSPAEETAPAVSPLPPLPPLAPARPRTPAFLARALPIILIIGGVASAGVALSKGFTPSLPGRDTGITVRVSEPADLEPVGTVLPSDAAAPKAAPATVSTAAGGPERAAGSASESAKPAPAKSPVKSPSTSSKRAALRGTGASVEVPTGWRVESDPSDEALEVRWRGSGVDSGRNEVVAYLLLQAPPLRRGEGLEDFAERLLEEFQSSVSPGDKVAYENDDEIADFHGVPALRIDIVQRGFMPYRMRNYYWVKGGRGYLLSCYATAGSFEERLPAFQRMIQSIRF